MGNICTSAVKAILGRRLSRHLLYRRYYYLALRRSGFKNVKAEGEDAFIARWRQLSPYVDPYCYRLFSNFCGPSPDIIPEDIMHDVIEAALNPPQLWDVYEDKNMFPIILGEEYVPATVASRMAGGPIEHKVPLSSIKDPLFLKPSVNSSCGERIVRFERVGESYLSADGDELTDDYLYAYGDNLLLQKAVVQHPDTARFGTSSVNTMRLTVYRSVRDLRPHITCGIFRMGRNGAVVDNAVAGGLYVGIDVQRGCIRGDSFDIRGNHSHFGEYPLPCWEKTVEFAHYVASRIPHHHLIAMDIAVTADNRPILIEYNIGGFSAPVYNYTAQTVFGRYTDEVVDWVRERMS